jgi:hypothetical protein
MQAQLMTPQIAVVRFQAWEIFRILTALEEHEERGALDPALQDLRKKLNEALPFTASFCEHIPDSD